MYQSQNLIGVNELEIYCQDKSDLKSKWVDETITMMLELKLAKFSC